MSLNPHNIFKNSKTHKLSMITISSSQYFSTIQMSLKSTVGIIQTHKNMSKLYTFQLKQISGVGNPLYKIAQTINSLVDGYVLFPFWVIKSSLISRAVFITRWMWSIVVEWPISQSKIQSKSFILALALAGTHQWLQTNKGSALLKGCWVKRLTL